MLRAGSPKITIFGSPSSECGYSLTPAERQQRFIDRKRRLALYRNPPAQQEGVANDLRLLLQPVAAERFARHDVVSIAAEGMAHQRQIPSAAPLRLPDKIGRAHV